LRRKRAIKIRKAAEKMKGGKKEMRKVGKKRDRGELRPRGGKVKVG